mmetsp:Transcript_1790/g.1710  ORF Transcript_1790/g.1710 Transcript_1790/m.1710 type:complete len:84 (-) Transcript_1790:25-276(-)
MLTNNNYSTMLKNIKHKKRFMDETNKVFQNMERPAPTESSHHAKQNSLHQTNKEESHHQREYFSLSPQKFEILEDMESSEGGS